MRLTDADALEKKLNERYDYLLNENGPYDHFTDGYGEATSTVEEFPTVDAEVVVRCKDCNGSQVSDDEKYIICCRLGVRTGFWDFCSYGERKDGNNAT